MITDPHEIANVAGTAGIRYMLEATEGLALDVYFMMPSCVPSTGLDEAGAVLRASDLEAFYDNPRVLGLAEMMNSYGVVAGRSGMCGETGSDQKSWEADRWPCAYAFWQRTECVYYSWRAVGS